MLGNSGEKGRPEKPSISIVIPARNEAERLPPLLTSLQHQTLPPLEVIVVDDHSTDETAPIARSLGATVVPSKPLPEKWLGKPWACFQGALLAKGENVLFLDADVTVEKNGLDKLCAALQKNGGAVSVLPYHSMETAVEQFSAFFNLIQAAASNAFTLFGPNSPQQKPFGPVLFVSKTDYLKFGGHEAVKSSVVENYSLAEHLRQHKIPLTCFIGMGTVNFRMYAGGLRDIVNGWNKSFASGAGSTPGGVLMGLILWLTGCLGTTRHLFTAAFTGKTEELPLLAIFYGLYVFQIHRWLTRLGTFRWATSLLFPIPATFFVLVFLRSALFSLGHRATTWKGREIPS